jgi:ABC-type nitrate/sulfonate/bicarbonate transport system substrate-binding protein
MPPAGDDAADAEVGDPPPPPAAFVTETMAALLAAQGHRAQAADVYERLLARRPDDARLQSQLASLRGAPRPAPTGRRTASRRPTPRVGARPSSWHRPRRARL